MDRRQGNGIYAMIGAAAVVVVAFLVGALYWNAPGNGKSVDHAAPAAPPVTSSVADTAQPAAGNGSSGKPVKQADASAGDAEKPAAPSGMLEENMRKDKPSGKPVEKPAENEKTPEEKQSPPVNEAGPKPPQAQPANPAPVAIPAPAIPRAPAAPPAPVEAKRPVDKPDAKTAAPSFDHVRIEPSGENVFAGRVTPGATVEMVLGGEVYARAVADTSGLFALVAPPLPAGASQIYLRSIAPDGRREVSKESVTVMIGRDKARRPLVVLASPDKPTVVLSNPDSPDGRKPDAAETPSAGVKPAARPEVRIVSVEARDGGRLFVSGLAAPGATVKLYINGVMVAPGGADSEGKLSFAIARGMGAGDYRVRLDDIDPVSGHVKSKAEVAFNVPETEENPGETGISQVSTASPAEKQPDAFKPPAFETVTVSRGDSLWRISERRYGSGYLYLEVYDANLRKIQNPDVIYPGQVLVLPPLEAPPKP